MAWFELGSGVESGAAQEPEEVVEIAEPVWAGRIRMLHEPGQPGVAPGYLAGLRNPLFVEAAGTVTAGQRITLRTRHPANGRLMTVKPKITAAQPGTELRWASRLPGIIGGEHSFTDTPANRPAGSAS